ncbi:MAG: hypothetical protein RIF41_23030, partial [Polyangiaceae bacterium]
PTSEQILSLKICDPAMGSGAFLVEACRFLADRLLDAWQREGKTESLFSEEDDLTTYARRQVAERCLYGVDKNPFAVELAKLSLWLITLQREKPFTFLDHSLRCGDSLVGVDLEQITKFHWKVEERKKRKKKAAPMQLDLFHRELEVSLHEALQARERIAEMSQYDTPEANRDMRIAMEDADDALSRLRLIGDLLIGAFFAEKKDKAREKERVRRLDLIQNWLMDANALGPPEELVALAEQTRAELRPFHWAIEFPEVFWAGRVDPLTGQTEEEPAYLDGVVGNPPFLGGSQIPAKLGESYHGWLRERFPSTKGQCDLCAFFFLRAAVLLGAHGTLGFLATNTIAQGDTREAGLQYLLARGSKIYHADTALEWPGDAAVMVSRVLIAFGLPSALADPVELDGRSVATINSRLRPKPERPNPRPLESNLDDGVALGSRVDGEGFLLAPDERASMVAKDERNATRIFAYIGGREVNTHPSHAPERFIINFGRLSLEEARAWPALLERVETLVRPARMQVRGNRGKAGHGKKYWWQYTSRRDGLYEALRKVARCLVVARHTKHLSLAFMPTDRVFSDALCVFAFDEWSVFCTLQSRVHEYWARLLSSSMGSTLRYTATDCLETFPFPKPSPKAKIPWLEEVGERLYTERAGFMVDTDQGLTKTYNALKDPTVTAKSEHGDRIVHLRQLHLDMDRAVLEAYAEHTADPTWTNIEIPPYTTPQTPAEQDLHQRFEDHVLDKLFELNEIRARG